MLFRIEIGKIPQFAPIKDLCWMSEAYAKNVMLNTEYACSIDCEFSASLYLIRLFSNNTLAYVSIPHLTVLNFEGADILAKIHTRRLQD